MIVMLHNPTIHDSLEGKMLKVENHWDSFIWNCFLTILANTSWKDISEKWWYWFIPANFSCFKNKASHKLSVLCRPQERERHLQWTVPSLRSLSSDGKKMAPGDLSIHWCRTANCQRPESGDKLEDVFPYWKLKSAAMCHWECCATKRTEAWSKTR